MPDTQTSKPYLRVKVNGRSPPGQWRYTFPQDGTLIMGRSYEAWKTDIEKHYHRNGYPMPEDWVQQAEDQFCRLMPAGVCVYPDGSLPEVYVHSRVTLEDIVNGTKVLGAWAASGFALVSQEEADRRANICAACYANINVPGCTSCSNIMGMVSEAVGAQKLQADAQLYGKSCAYCHCASAANVWVPVEVSRHGVSDEMLNAMPEHCWKKAAIKELQDA